MLSSLSNAEYYIITDAGRNADPANKFVSLYPIMCKVHIASTTSEKPITLLTHLSSMNALSVGAAQATPSMDGSVPAPNANMTTAPLKNDAVEAAVNRTE